jgi:hypothetical protein
MITLKEKYELVTKNLKHLIIKRYNYNTILVKSVKKKY